MRRHTTLRIVTLIAILLALVAWQQRWFSGEPTYRGRTVTEWLDRLVLYEYRYKPEALETVLRSAEAVAHDPALEALLKLGRSGVPTLLKRLADRAEWEPEISTITRWRRLIRWKWHRLRGGVGSAPEGLYSWSEAQQARKNAAAFVLMALGTNGGAGFIMYIEAYAAAPKHESIYRTKVAGSPVGSSSSLMANSVVTAIPARRDELVSEIMRGLEHTNAWCRVVAMECARRFMSELVQRKDLLLKLAHDVDPFVQQATLGALSMLLWDQNAGLMPPAEIKEIAQAVADDRRNSQGVRGHAESVMKQAREKMD